MLCPLPFLFCPPFPAHPDGNARLAVAMGRCSTFPHFPLLHSPDGGASGGVAHQTTFQLPHRTRTHHAGHAVQPTLTSRLPTSPCLGLYFLHSPDGRARGGVAIKTPDPLSTAHAFALQGTLRSPHSPPLLLFPLALASISSTALTGEPAELSPPDAFAIFPIAHAYNMQGMLRSCTRVVAQQASLPFHCPVRWEAAQRRTSHLQGEASGRAGFVRVGQAVEGEVS